MTNSRICKVEGCGKDAKNRGWCWGHYDRNRRHGDPLAGRLPVGEGLKFCKIAAEYKIKAECLEWPYGKDSNGYGIISLRGKVNRAHRYVCKLAHGHPPFEGAVAAHSCGDARCVNPHHLRWATEVENAADKIAHGTHVQGAAHKFAKLTDETAMEIYLDKGNVTQAALAAKYGVSRGVVGRIQRKQKWLHIHK